MSWLAQGLIRGGSVMGMASAKPRRFLFEDDAHLFGVLPTARWVWPAHIADQAPVLTAYRQHLIACNVTAALRRRGLSRAAFARELGLVPGTTRQKLNGVVPMRREDEALWALHLRDDQILPPDDALEPPT